MKKIIIMFTLFFGLLLGVNTLKAEELYEPIDEFKTSNLLYNAIIEEMVDEGVYFYSISFDIFNDLDINCGYTFDGFYSYIFNFDCDVEVGLTCFVYMEEMNQYFPALHLDNINSQELIIPSKIIGEVISQPNIFYIKVCFVLDSSNPISDFSSLGLYNYQSELISKNEITNTDNMFSNYLRIIDNLFVSPIDDYLMLINIDMSSITLSPGIGNVTWFTIDLKTLISIIFAFTGILILFKFVYKLIKKFFKNIMGVFNV